MLSMGKAQALPDYSKPPGEQNSMPARSSNILPRSNLAREAKPQKHQPGRLVANLVYKLSLLIDIRFF